MAMGVRLRERERERECFERGRERMLWENIWVGKRIRMERRENKKRIFLFFIFYNML